MWNSFDRILKKTEIPEPCLCEHKRISEGVCKECFEILWRVQVTSGRYVTYSYRHVVDKSKAKKDRFHNAHCIPACVCTDYEKFLKVYEGLEKKRKNFLINKFVAFQLFRRKGVPVETYLIKSKKSSEEHNDLCQKIFNKFDWGEIY